MRYLIPVFAIVLAVGLLAGNVSPAAAQATRTWVSGVGDDANPCSRTAPCKTFAGAISKTAAGGEISVLDPGGFGAVTITKSITINGDGTLAGILSASTTGIIVNGAGIDVHLRNITINGGGTGLNGIRFLQGSSLTLDRVSVYSVKGSNAKAMDIQPSNAGAEVVIRDSMFINNSQGVEFLPGAGASVRGTIENSIFANNGTYGLRVNDSADVTVSNSQSVNNGSNGFIAASASATASLFIQSSVAAGNGFGAIGGSGIKVSGSAARVRITQNMVTNNFEGLSKLSSGVMETFQDNYVTGNTTNIVGGAPSVIAKT